MMQFHVGIKVDVLQGLKPTGSSTRCPSYIDNRRVSQDSVLGDKIVTWGPVDLRIAAYKDTRPPCQTGLCHWTRRWCDWAGQLTHEHMTLARAVSDGARWGDKYSRYGVSERSIAINKGVPWTFQSDLPLHGAALEIG